MAIEVPTTHAAVVITAPRAPLGLMERETRAPEAGEVVVHVEWTSSTPLDLHQADGGLLVSPPAVCGSSFAGTVVQRGPPPPPGTPSYSTADVRVGEKVFGMAWRNQTEKCHQTYITIPTFILGRIPKNLSPQEAVTAPANLITALHTITKDLGLPLPWPVPQGWTPPAEVRDAPVVVWGAASSVGQYVLQVLRHWGYEHGIAVASSKHHGELERIGAAACFDYRDTDVADKILAHVGSASAAKLRVPFIIDCIGSIDGTLRRLTQVAEAGTKVAIMLPVIVRDATKEVAPEYEMDVSKCLTGEWRDGVELRGVRTHFYTDVSPSLTPPLFQKKYQLIFFSFKKRTRCLNITCNRILCQAC